MRLVVGAAVIAIACGASAQGQTLQEQDLCAKQAQKAFELWQGDSANLNLPKSIDTYQSHYSLSLKKCFIRIQSAMSFAGISESALLIDAYEQRVYAFYSEHIPSSQMADVKASPFIACELTPSFREKKSCSSKDEFETFVARFMEQ